MHPVRRWQVQLVPWVRCLHQHDGPGLQPVRSRDILDRPGPEHDVRRVSCGKVFVPRESEGGYRVQGLRERHVFRGWHWELHGLRGWPVRYGRGKRLYHVSCWQLWGRHGQCLYSLSSGHVCDSWGRF
jgi:hypothetical protein